MTTQNPTSVSRRISQSIEHYMKSDWENALVQLVPAIDATAKRRRPAAQNKKRMIAFFQDHEVMIWHAAVGSVIKKCQFGQMTFPKALYEWMRCPIAHEGQIAENIRFIENGPIGLSEQFFSLHVRHIFALQMAVIISKENKNEWIENAPRVEFFGETRCINDHWGAEDYFSTKLSLIYPIL